MSGSKVKPTVGNGIVSDDIGAVSDSWVIVETGVFCSYEHLFHDCSDCATYTHAIALLMQQSEKTLKLGPHMPGVLPHTPLAPTPPPTDLPGRSLSLVVSSVLTLEPAWLTLFTLSSSSCWQGAMDSKSTHVMFPYTSVTVYASDMSDI